MNKEILSFTIKAPKTRAHYVLFSHNTPFTPKVVKDKTLYKRNPKHRNKVEE